MSYQNSFIYSVLIFFCYFVQTCHVTYLNIRCDSFFYFSPILFCSSNFMDKMQKLKGYSI